MLGEIIGEFHGKVGPAGVVDGQGIADVSGQESGKILGMEVTNWLTFRAVPRPDGTFWGEGQGTLTTKGGEFVKWKSHGLGWQSGRGNVTSWRGALYFQNASSKLARLLKTLAVYEYECDEKGNTRMKLWEWK